MTIKRRATRTPDAPIRVAYLVPPSAHFAGVERVVTDIADGLAREHGDALDVHVIFCNAFDELTRTEHAFQLHTLGVDRLRGLRRPLRAVVRSARFDMLICAQVEPSVPAWLATRGLGVRKFITHLHGNPQMELERGGIRSRLAFWVFQHLLARRMSAVFCVSPSLRDHARRLLNGRVPTEFAPNPTRPLRPQRVPAEPLENGVRFLNVGRLSYQKGQDVLLKAFAVAHQDLPDSALTIVGSGEDEVDLKDLCARLGLDGAVHFAGYQEDPSEYFYRSTHFVLSSRWEGLPGVLLEALQVGMPIVTTSCQFGPEDLVENDAIGRVAPVDDPQSLGEAMTVVARWPRSAHAVKARREIADRFLPARATERHFDLLMDAWRGKR